MLRKRGPSMRSLVSKAKSGGRASGGWSTCRTDENTETLPAPGGFSSGVVASLTIPGRTVRTPVTKSIVPGIEALSFRAGGRRILLYQPENYCVFNVLCLIRAGDDRLAESCKRCLQATVPGGIDGGFDTLGRLRVDFGRRLALRARRWSRRRRTVYVGDPRHRAVAVIGGNPFENLGFEMLKLDRNRPRDAYPECAVRPQAVGPRAGGDGLAHDRSPLGGDPRCCESARLEGSGGNSLDQRGERLRLAGLAHVRSRTSGVPTQGVRPTTPAVKWLRRQ